MSTGQECPAFTGQFLTHGLFMWGLLVLTGCAAAFEPPPLPATHPAHPEAMVASQPPQSTTLAYRLSDIPSPQPASYMASRKMAQAETGSSREANGETFVGEGKVVAVVPGGNQVVVDHKEIKGFMDAMTMGYRVEPPSLLQGLQAGDEVRFTIDSQKKVIVKINKLNK